jgi:ArsR family transcriptional regulator
MHDFVQVMKALSDPNRVKIIKMLQLRELCVCEIQSALGLAQSTVSKHLKILETAGMIASSKSGLWVYYRLTNGGLNPYVASLLGNIRHWLETDPEVRAVKERLTSIRREDVCRR